MTSLKAQNTTELSVIEEIQPANALAVFEKEDAVQNIIDRLRKEATSAVFDVNTPTGRKEIGGLAHKIARSKTALDKMGKGLVDGIKQQARVIDANRKLARDQLDLLKAEVRRPLTQWEEAEQLRVDALRSRLEKLRSAPEFAKNKDGSEALKQFLVAIENIEIDGSWQEFKADAAIAKDNAISSIKPLIESAENEEAKAAELERLRKEKAEREAAESKVEQERKQKEREQKIREEAAKQARREAELKAKRKAERQRVKAQKEREAHEMAKARAAAQVAEAKRQAAEAELKAKQAAEDERQRIADKEALMRREAEQRAANEQHRALIFDGAYHDLKEIVDKDAAMKVAVAIRDNLISNVTINY